MSNTYDQMMDQMRQEATTLDACPLATQDEEANTNNRQGAVEQADYREADAGSEQRCGTCQFFDQTPAMISCIEAGPIQPDKGEPGYCGIWDFVCGSDMICTSWSPADA